MPKKCIFCKQIIPKEEEEFCTPYKGRLAHNDCFNSAMKLIKQDKDEQLDKKSKEIKTKKSVKRPKAELKGGLSDEEYKDKQEYYDYLKQILNTDKLTAKIYALSDRYLTQYGWSWAGMKNALVYMNEIKEKELTGDVVGLLPFVYEEAEEFFNEVKKVEERSKNTSLSDMYQTKRIIYHKRPDKVAEDLVIESINENRM